MLTQVGRYRVERILGEGAASKVYLALDPKLGRRVAVKVLASDADPALRDRFLLEARAIAALKHPNIVGLLDYSGEQDEMLYLVMEYFPARSLYALVHEHGPMSEPTALCVGHEVALALAHAHATGVVHRDVKPENILLGEGRVVLTDFGGVKVVRPGPSRRGESRTHVLGTPGFMPPEQFAGRGIGPRTDVFSLGASLYNVTTGRIPYDGGSVDGTYKNLKSGRYIDPRTHRALLSPEFGGLLARCLAPRPEERFESADALREAAHELLVEHGVEEVRQELVAYERTPAHHAVAQRERAVEHWHAQLRRAVSENDFVGAHALVERIRRVAPADPRANVVTGTRVAGQVSSRGAYRAGLRRGLGWGVALGAALVAAAWVLAGR